MGVLYRFRSALSGRRVTLAYLPATVLDRLLRESGEAGVATDR